MLISVVIVSWNAKAYLLECLNSVIAQGFAGEMEVIVVDNASSDGSPDAVRDRYPTVNLIRNQTNQGFARANNVGIRMCTGEHVFLINSDAVVSPGCFEKMIRYMNAHSRVGVLGPRIVGSDGQVQRSCMQYPSLGNALTRALALDTLFPRSRWFGAHLMTFWGHDDTRDVDVINGCFWMLRRAALNEVGLLDERFLIYGEDVDWCRRFNDAGWRVRFYHEVQALHYGGASSSNAPVKYYLEMQRANHQYWEKHHSRLQATLSLLINILHHGVRLAGELVAFPFAGQRKTTFALRVERNVAAIQWAFRTLFSSGAQRQLEAAERRL